MNLPIKSIYTELSYYKFAKESVSVKESVKEGWRVSLKMTCQPSALITMDLRSMAKASNWKTHFSHSVTKQYARSAAGCKNGKMSHDRPCSANTYTATLKS